MLLNLTKDDAFVQNTVTAENFDKKDPKTD